LKGLRITSMIAVSECAMIIESSCAISMRGSIWIEIFAILLHMEPSSEIVDSCSSKLSSHPEVIEETSSFNSIRNIPVLFLS
jgi:hypothetical protein